MILGLYKRLNFLYKRALSGKINSGIEMTVNVMRRMRAHDDKNETYDGSLYETCQENSIIKMQATSMT